MLIFGIHIIIVLFSVLRILARDNLTPTTRLAWFMVIITLPFIGIIVYLLFGEISLGHNTNQQHREIFNNLLRLNPEALGDTSSLTNLVDNNYHSAFRYAASINKFGTTIGNHAELMSDAATARARLLDDINAAKQEVNVLYYIWLNDDTGTNLANALIHATNRGVRCKAMVDGLGSRQMINSALWQKMKDAGVEVAVALPISNLFRTILFSRIDLRNHRKITIIDGNITYCGSQNCADPEFRIKEKYAPWVDIMLRIQGPVVAQNQLLFASDWLLHKSTSINDFLFFTESTVDGFPAQIIGDGPTLRYSSTPQLFTTLIHQAQTELIISTPYFVPDSTVLESLCAAALRKVNVTLIMPKRNDSWIVAAASRSYYKILLESGVNIYEFNGGLLHSKTLTIDNIVTFIGSSNMDIRSFNLNYENDILLYDSDTTMAVKNRQNDYKTQSDPVFLEQVLNWKLSQRLWNNVIATIGPVL